MKTLQQNTLRALGAMTEHAKCVDQLPHHIRQQIGDDSVKILWRFSLSDCIIGMCNFAFSSSQDRAQISREIKRFGENDPLGGEILKRSKNPEAFISLPICVATAGHLAQTTNSVPFCEVIAFIRGLRIGNLRGHECPPSIGFYINKKQLTEVAKRHRISRLFVSMYPFDFEQPTKIKGIMGMDFRNDFSFWENGSFNIDSYHLIEPDQWFIFPLIDPILH